MVHVEDMKKLASKRPRIKDKDTRRRLKTIQKKLRYIQEEDDPEWLDTYKGERDEIRQGRIIKEALKALQQQDLQVQTDE